jgi:hypothetical protein
VAAALVLAQQNFSRMNKRATVQFSARQLLFMNFAAAIVVAAASIALTASAFAQVAKPEDAIKYRQSAQFVLAQHFGRIGAVVDGKAPFDGMAAVANRDWPQEGPARGAFSLQFRRSDVDLARDRW